MCLATYSIYTDIYMMAVAQFKVIKSLFLEKKNSCNNDTLKEVIFFFFFFFQGTLGDSCMFSTIVGIVLKLKIYMLPK